MIISKNKLMIMLVYIPIASVEFWQYKPEYKQTLENRKNRTYIINIVTKMYFKTLLCQ